MTNLRINIQQEDDSPYSLEVVDHGERVFLEAGTSSEIRARLNEYLTSRLSQYDCPVCEDTGYSGGTMCLNCDGQGCDQCDETGSVPCFCECLKERVQIYRDKEHTGKWFFRVYREDNSTQDSMPNYSTPTLAVIAGATYFKKGRLS